MKVLIVRLSALGDVVQGIPCLVALKRSFPDWKISWLVEDSYAPVLSGHPCLEHVFVLHREWRKGRRFPSASSLFREMSHINQVRKELLRQQFDVAIDLQGLFKSGLWCRLSNAARRVGHGKTREFAHLFLTDTVGDRPTFDIAFPLVKRYLEPAVFLGANPENAAFILPPPSPEVKTAAENLLAPLKAGKGNAPLVALCPWSAWPSKNWPLSHWRALIQAINGRCRLLLIGAARDQPFAKTLADDQEGILDLSGKTSIPLLAEIFRRCRLVIGPDSGPVHLANAAAVPRVLMLFGSTSWRRSGPVGEGHRALSLNLPCQPCFHRTCPLSHQACMQNLDVARVLEACQSLLGDQEAVQE